MSRIRVLSLCWLMFASLAQSRELIPDHTDGLPPVRDDFLLHFTLEDGRKLAVKVFSADYHSPLLLYVFMPPESRAIFSQYVEQVTEVRNPLLLQSLLNRRAYFSLGISKRLTGVSSDSRLHKQLLELKALQRSIFIHHEFVLPALLASAEFIRNFSDPELLSFVEQSHDAYRANYHRQVIAAIPRDPDGIQRLRSELRRSVRYQRYFDLPTITWFAERLQTISGITDAKQRADLLLDHALVANLTAAVEYEGGTLLDTAGSRIGENVWRAAYILHRQDENIDLPSLAEPFELGR